MVFLKYYSSHFMFSGYKVFLSSFSSTKSRRFLKLKQLNVCCYLEQNFHWDPSGVIQYKETPQNPSAFLLIEFL